MKTSLVAAAALAAGVLLGLGMTAARFQWAYGGSDLARLLTGTESRQPALPPPAGPQPRVVVDNETYVFDAMERGGTESHAFRFANQGDYPLELTKGDTTCKCTISTLDEARVMPGESVDVVLEWTATTDASHFRQSATIFTNDPDRQRISLTVEGKVTQSIVVEPPQLVFSKLQVEETRSSELRLISFRDADLRVIEHRFRDEQSADQFEVVTEPLPADALELPDALSGVLVRVTVKPGLPVGPIDERLELTTTAAGGSAIEVPVLGRVASDLSLFGRGWDATRGILFLGAVQSDKGARRELSIFARGSDAAHLEVRTESVKPDLLQVSFGEPREVKEGEVYQVPLVVEIPAGSPAANYLGSDQAPLGEILIGTNHPRARQLRLLVRFAVER